MRAAQEIGVELGEPRGEMRALFEPDDGSAVASRRGQVGSWRSAMPAAREELFWRDHGATMEALGYER